MKDKFYITTPIYYANASPHIGHAYTTIKADVLTRWKKSLGKEVFFSVGMDEHGLKIQDKALEIGKEPQQLVDEVSSEFKKLWEDLDIDYTGFVRTTDAKHKEAVRKVLTFFYDKGAIYKGVYKGLYCVGCEQFIAKSQLIDGKCPDHGKVPEIFEEENYLLAMKALQPELVKKIESDELQITPSKRKNEVLSFLKQELQDISISRPKEKVSWGIALPFDEGHVSYVWFDAFLNYLTVFGWDGDNEKIPEFFPPDAQFVGKDILRVHSTIWPAILLHLGLFLPKEIYAHGLILSGGKKMSKTLGNVVDPKKLIDEYGKDAVRYYLMRHTPSFEDGEISYERFREVYNADLANGLGNLTSRILKMSESYLDEPIEPQLGDLDSKYKEYMENYEFNKAMDFIWEKIGALDLKIQETQPFKLIKTDEKQAKKIVTELVKGLFSTAQRLEPFMPATAERIKQAITANKMPEPLFLRKN